MRVFYNSLKKIICVLLLIFLLISLIPYKSNCAEFGTPSDFSGTSQVDEIVKKPAVTIISIVRIIGATIAVVMLLAISIKYMTSAAGERADIKKHAVAYVVGAFILFGAVGILGILNQIGQGIK